jgi:hypothetical protein
LERVKEAEQIISQEVDAVCANSALVRGNGCAACHVLSTVAVRMGLSEADAADLLSEVLLERPELNERFVGMVEQVHMKERMAGVGFAVKRRNEKDVYLESQLKNALEELLSDTAKHGTEIAMRKLVITQVALQIAQNLGIDYHAATEELYYYMRKHDRQTHEEITKIIKSMLGRGRK